MRVRAGVVVMSAALLAAGLGACGGPAAAGAPEPGAIGGDPLDCAGVAVPREALDGTGRPADDLDEERREVLLGGPDGESPLAGPDDLAGWQVVEDSDERLALLRELPVVEDLGAGDVRTHELLLVDRDWPDGEWHYRSAGSCALTVPLGGLGRAGTVLADGEDLVGVSVDLLVTERACNSGEDASGRIEVVDLLETPTTVSFVLGVRERGGVHACPSNPPTPFTLELERPLGDRSVVDASVLPGRVLHAGTVVGDLDCAPGDEAEAGFAGLEEGARGTTRDPVEAAEDWLGDRTRFGDRLVVGEPRTEGTDGAQVGVERDGRVVAVVHLLEADDGTLLLEGYEACSGALA